MCGRYASSSRPQDLVEEFDVDDDRTGERVRSILVNPQNPMAGHPDFNIAPTKAAPVVLTRAPRGDADSDTDAEPRRQLRLLTWGLVPSWSQDIKVGTRMANARAETVLGKSSFVRAAAFRRCLVPADGWYEWQVSPTAVGARGKPRRQPFFVHRSDGEPLAMAGLYEFWRDGSLADGDPDAWLATYTIITTRAEHGLDRIHDRQPLVLEREDWDDWLDPAANDLTRVKDQLEFAKPGRFDAYPVSMGVNSSRTNGVQLLLPLDRSELMGVVDPTTGEIIGT
ncbi:MAG: hypothetical protein QOE58_2090 [Actinomycetota bacterium]|jgi:putative SOS response-associated peptidase YedK|nr:hypothetical protein [Actinomycetota bacterium]